MKELETFYERLKVNPKATVAEIVTAYHTARGAFSKDSVAVYSLFSADEIQAELQKLEEAFVTLSNIDKRAAYDRRLLHGEVGSGETAEAAPIQQSTPPAGRVHQGSSSTAAPSGESITPPAETAAAVPEAVNGVFLRQAREGRSLSVDDVARITKIPSRYVEAIESDHFKKLPARVYVQGFIKNLAALYRLDSKTLVQRYLIYWDLKNPPA